MRITMMVLVQVLLTSAVALADQNSCEKTLVPSVVEGLCTNQPIVLIDKSYCRSCAINSQAIKGSAPSITFEGNARAAVAEALNPAPESEWEPASKFYRGFLKDPKYKDYPVQEAAIERRKSSNEKELASAVKAYESSKSNWLANKSKRDPEVVKKLALFDESILKARMEMVSAISASKSGGLAVFSKSLSEQEAKLQPLLAKAAERVKQANDAIDQARRSGKSLNKDQAEQLNRESNEAVAQHTLLVRQRNQLIEGYNLEIQKHNLAIRSQNAQNSEAFNATEAAANRLNQRIKERNEFVRANNAAEEAAVRVLNDSSQKVSELTKELKSIQADEAALNKDVGGLKNAWLADYIKKTEAMLKGVEAEVRESAKSKNCGRAGVNIKWVASEGAWTAAFKGHGLPPESAVQEMKGIIEKSKKDGEYCSEPYLARSDLSPATEFVYDVNPEDFFKDNQTTLDSDKLGRILGKIQKDLKLGSKLPSGCKRVVDGISIQTSANLLANTEGWADRPWDFESLSRERAEFLKAKVGGFLDQKRKAGILEFQDNQNPAQMTKIDYLGDNLDGTSGKCPYKLTELEDEQKQKKGIYKVEKDLNLVSKDELEKSKFARIRVSLAPSEPGCGISTGADTEKDVSHLSSQCFKPVMSCK
jgi:hypothetical protein